MHTTSHGLCAFEEGVSIAIQAQGVKKDFYSTTLHVRPDPFTLFKLRGAFTPTCFTPKFVDRS